MYFPLALLLTILNIGTGGSLLVQSNIGKSSEDDVLRCGLNFEIDGKDFWLPRRKQDFSLPQIIDYAASSYPSEAPTRRQSADQGDVVWRFFSRNPEIAKSIVLHHPDCLGLSPAECTGALIRGKLKELDCDDDQQLRLIAQRACQGQSAPLPIPPLGSRSEIGFFFESEGFKSGAEIGVQRGINAKNMLERWPSGNSLLLVDPWTPMGDTYKVRTFRPFSK